MTGSRDRPRILPKEVVTARDGVDLVGDVFLPDTSGASPTVIVRTPYGRSQTLLLQIASRLRSEGLSVLLQDCRGRHSSAGAVDLLCEREDTEETATWVARQPWSDGSIAFLGMSISSLYSFPVAAEPPPGVRVAGMINLMGAHNLYTMVYRAGAVVLHWALPWFHLISSRGSSWQNRPWQELFRQLPLDSIPEGGFDLSRWREVLAHPEYDAHWEALDASRWLPQIEAPTLSVTGWHDFMLAQTLDAFEVMSEAHPDRHKLIVGPWDHQSLLGNFSRAPSALEKAGALDLMKIVVSWFRRWMLPDAIHSTEDRSWDDHPNVVLFVLGDGRWIGADEYPLSSSGVEELFTTSGADASGGDGGARLVSEGPSGGTDAFTYDPERPVPTVGGAVWPFAAMGLHPGPADQSAVEGREDVLVYTGEALDRDLVVVGPIEVSLRVSTSASDTCFTAKLVDLAPDGTARIVQDGIVRLGHSLRRDGVASLQSGATCSCTIDLEATAYRFKAGHRLRLDVSSSNFPRFARCVNASSPPGELHHQRIHHGGETPSRLRLTVLAEGVEERATIPLGSSGRREVAKPGGLSLKERISSGIWRLMRPVMAQFGRPTGRFGFVVGRLLAYYNKQINRQALRHLEVRPTDHVLEIGFGPGLAIEAISKQAVDGHVVGIDHSEVMVRVGSRRNTRAIRDGRVELLHVALDALDYPPGSFDKVLTVNSIQLFPSATEALRVIWRLLKEDGRLVVARQPRGETTRREVVYEMASQIASQMRSAGFVSVRPVITLAKPVDIACVVGTKPRSGRRTAAGHSPQVLR